MQLILDGGRAQTEPTHSMATPTSLTVVLQNDAKDAVLVHRLSGLAGGVAIDQRTRSVSRVKQHMPVLTELLRLDGQPMVLFNDLLYRTSDDMLIEAAVGAVCLMLADIVNARDGEETARYWSDWAEEWSEDGRFGINLLDEDWMLFQEVDGVNNPDYTHFHGGLYAMEDDYNNDDPFAIHTRDEAWQMMVLAKAVTELRKWQIGADVPVNMWDNDFLESGYFILG